MIIAVDFDGTIVDHRYPAIGKTKLFAFETLKTLQRDGHQLILWTYRGGELLNEAVEFCEKNGVEFFAVNSSFPGETLDDSQSRKIHADLFIDDRNIGGFPGWGEVYQMLNPNKSSNEYLVYQKEYLRAKRRTLRGFVKYLFGKE